MQTSIIRPGLLVSLKTNIRGGVQYQTRTIEADHSQGAARVATWETRREIADAEEHENAIKARGLARTAILRTCCASTFGLLCPSSNESALTEGIAQARTIAEAFNATAKFSRLDVFVIAGRIADSDTEAAKAIGSEVRELIEAMERGVRNADPVAIREAANKAREVSGMLSADTAAAVSAAIAEVRSVARDIVRRVEKSGETAASIVQGLQLEALKAARFAVLDVDAAEQTEAAPVDMFAPAIDLAPMDDAATAEAGPAPSIDFEPGPAVAWFPVPVFAAQPALEI